MAKFTFNLPDIGEGIAEAEIVDWHVKIGDTVDEDDRLADMMTDKATVEMESPVAGKVIEVAGEVGDTIAIGSMLVVIEVEGEVPDDAEDHASEEGEGDEAAPAPAPKADEIEQRIEVENPDASDADDAAAAAPASAPKPATAEAEAPAPQPGADKSKHAKVLASPAVRKRAKDLGIDLGEVKPAADGRVRHADLDAFLSYNGAGGFASAARTRADEEIKVIGLRKRIAQNMAEAKRNIPHFSYVEECDVTDLERLRADLNAGRGDKPKLTMLPLIITAICKILPDYPMINARYDDEAGVVTRHGAVHLGMATQTDKGLMVPVIRDAQTKNLWQLAREIVRLANAARDGSAKSDELSGSTLTVTSLGPLGGVATTPVINRPEVAIIGPNRIVERPMFVPDGIGGERIEKRKLMNISISCDHRVVDGWDAASFVQALKRLIETPALMLAD
ncbi:dihydrolipoamide acetyltransferase family protein [Pelagerythrobacter marensis]|uniref:Dihydrolipoamide acetyltransferase component of pyruvate dehydrogenase complex n=1 Tax=Pelagerythrobacter marensis TaxID=543877 RepID=A0A0G3X950_9SPHN|nr:dihydrolipoamide acetyltransferase family protein [Pelagerythrobacter marensis]AKM07134.1 2-oxoisovalerate dehydrogenase, E2 component, dihydrolipamideacetyltransferase [Pelagerythrobacter marensis]